MGVFFRKDVMVSIVLKILNRNHSVMVSIGFIMVNSLTFRTENKIYI